REARILTRTGLRPRGPPPRRLTVSSVAGRHRWCGGSAPDLARCPGRNIEPHGSPSGVRRPGSHGSKGETMRAHLALGRDGEDLAARWYTDHGFHVVDRNWRTTFGEIDL